MNRTQLVCLLVTILLVLATGSWVQGRMIGEELIATTNSVHAVHVGAGLKGYLEDFLKSPASVDEVALGDNPVSDGTADACVLLSNKLGQRVGIRINRAETPQKFHILGYWKISEGAANSR